MASHLKTFLVFLFVAITLRGCGEEEAQVDEHFTESTEYRQFQRDIERESERRYNSLPEYINKLSECDYPYNMNLPLTISVASLDSFISDAPGECEEYETEYPTTVLGKSRVNGLDLLWLVVENQSIYDDKELILLTQKDGRILESQTLGVFRKNPSTTDETQVEATPANGGAVISTEMTSRREYPIGQRYQVKATFRVNPLGGIEKVER